MARCGGRDYRLMKRDREEIANLRVEAQRLREERKETNRALTLLISAIAGPGAIVDVPDGRFGVDFLVGHIAYALAPAKWWIYKQLAPEQLEALGERWLRDNAAGPAQEEGAD